MWEMINSTLWNYKITKNLNSGRIKKPIHFWFLQSQKLYEISFDHLTPDVPSTSLDISHRRCKHKGSWQSTMKMSLRNSEPLQEAAKNKHIFQVGGKRCQGLTGIFCRSGNEQRSCRNGSVEGAWARELSLQGNLPMKSIIYLMVRLRWVESSQVNLEVSKNVP